MEGKHQGTAVSRVPLKQIESANIMGTRGSDHTGPTTSLDAKRPRNFLVRSCSQVVMITKVYCYQGPTGILAPLEWRGIVLTAGGRMHNIMYFLARVLDTTPRFILVDY